VTVDFDAAWRLADEAAVLAVVKKVGPERFVYALHELAKRGLVTTHAGGIALTFTMDPVP